MRVLFLSFYFQPDLCAGSFRATALAEALAARLGPDDTVEVITTMPNRYQSFKVAAPAVENRGNLRISRVALPGHCGGMADQSRAFMVYAREVWRRTAGVDYDLVFATSSRLMTAVLGGRVAQRAGVPLYLDMRDIFCENLAAMFAGKPQSMVVPLLRRLERWTIRRAARVNLVSEGFVDYFRELRDDLDYRVFTNGIPDLFLRHDVVRYDSSRQGGRRVILYAGNIGGGQALHRVLPQAAEALADTWEFRIIGDGGAREALAKALRAREVGNVFLESPVPPERLPELYAGADVLFLHLDDCRAMERVIPSKIFEYAATGKPILAGVAGYARSFIKQHVSGAAFFQPCDASGLVAALEGLPLSLSSRRGFREQFARSAIMGRLADDILDLAGMRDA